MPNYGLSMSCSPNDGFILPHMSNRRKRSNANLIAESSSSSSTSSLYHSSNNLDMNDNQIILEPNQQQQQTQNIPHSVYHNSPLNLVNRSNCLSESNHVYVVNTGSNLTSGGVSTGLSVANNSSMNNLCASTSQLQIIQEEQNDLRSASTTPRLSQTSTVSNSSYVDNGELSNSLSCSTVTMVNVNEKSGYEANEKCGNEVSNKRPSVSIHVSFNEPKTDDEDDDEDEYVDKANDDPSTQADVYANENHCEYAQRNAQFHYCDANNIQYDPSVTDSNNNNGNGNNNSQQQMLFNANGMMNEHCCMKYVNSPNLNCCNNGLFLNNYKYNNASSSNTQPNSHFSLQQNFDMQTAAAAAASSEQLNNNNANTALFFHNNFNAPIGHSSNMPASFNFMQNNLVAPPLYETYLKYPNLFPQIPLSQSSSQ